MENSIVKVEHLSHRYSVQWAIRDINFEINQRGIMGLLGSNGAGKSTTMNIITGYLGATSGTVTINGHDIFKEPEEAKKCVGYLPEIPPLYTDMTVLEYLNFVAELKKLEKGLRKRYVEEAMETTGILDVKNRMIRNLSKGYRQRVGFAQAILGYPEIIILDEPTVGLDPKQIIEIRDLIRKLGEKHTVILSSHILTEISAVCDHVFIISKGKLVASDSTENLLEQMSGAQEIELIVRSESARAQELLEEIEYVEHVQIKDEQEGRILVRAKTGTDVREEVFRQMAENHIPVLEMHTVTKSLEDVFLQITQEGGNQ